MKRTLFYFLIFMICVYNCQRISDKAEASRNINNNLANSDNIMANNMIASPTSNMFDNQTWLNKNGASQIDTSVTMNKLAQMNAELDAELSKYKQLIRKNPNQSFLRPKFTQLSSESNDEVIRNQTAQSIIPLFKKQDESGLQSGIFGYNDYSQNVEIKEKKFPQIAVIDEKYLNTKLDFISKESKDPGCIRREGLLKIRDADQKDKEVIVTYAVLTKERLSYFVNAKDESSIQGSIELDKIKESLKLINGFPSCFTIKTLDSVSDCSICSESEDSAREWINAITQNSVNCNTISSISNLSKRGMLR